MFLVHFYPKREIETASVVAVVVVLLCFPLTQITVLSGFFSSTVSKWIPCPRFLQLFFDLPKVGDRRRRDNVFLSRSPPTAHVSFFPWFLFLKYFLNLPT